MCRLLKVPLAMLSRFLFAMHGVVTVWHVVAVTGEPLYWLLLTGVALLVVEMAVTMKCTGNGEWKWFSPMVFLYLSTVIPSIWFLELSLLDLMPPVNDSSRLDLLDGIPVVGRQAVKLEPGHWVEGLEQTMLIVLVLGRWMMPKGNMSRDQLSQLLMVYVGLGADILEILDTFKEPDVKTNWLVVVVGLALFSWALMQFPLVLTQTRHPKGQCRFGVSSPFASCCSSEAWSLLLTVGLQDGPFLLYRLYLMIHEQVLNQSMIFFTCKNILIVLLELYRIFVVQCEPQVGKFRSKRYGAVAMQCQTQGVGEEEVQEEEQEEGTEECCGEPSCHPEVEEEGEEGNEREGDQRNVQV